MTRPDDYADHTTGASRDTGTTAQQDHDRYTGALARTVGVADVGCSGPQPPINPRRDSLDALRNRQGE